MKNYFKKFSIMFVMLLAVIGVGVIQNGSVANAATVGQQLTSPEAGWRRIDSADSKIKYNGFTQRTTGVSSAYNGTDAWASANDSLNFKFYGTKLRIIGVCYVNSSNNVKITVDGKSEIFDCTKFNGSTAVWQVLQYEMNSLPQGIHEVTITNLTTNLYSYYFDAIDIDDNGYLVDPNKSITLNKSSINLKKDDSKQLNATTIPSALDVVWSSSDETIATVDENGNVKGITVGTVTITAQIKGSETKATCEVTVTLKDKKPPVDEPTGDGNLYIEMVDGNIKQAQDLDVTDFIKWFKNRDLDDNDNPIYKIKNAKGNVEYLVHDKVVAFEIR
ncbi:bacterial Ig-like domain protein [Clostridium puniceum]|uniref:Bacterial Ig-like domain protein n=1 Tax=Clostridium puniceum TaxID=29367 RepID=A0A1S8TXY3_9CLOT|nr:Ig-like domain-containing protein [Clostridium puniceum]OOM82616.1 bacterial Ig-like domain protein [Clostridium puniceum]